MWSFLRRSRQQSAPPAIDHPAQVLLDEVQRVDPERLEQVAMQLTSLWSAFVEQFGGPRQFLDEPPTQQQAFVDQLGRVVERSKNSTDPILGQYYYSAALFRQYLEAFRARDTSPPSLALSGFVVELMERGRRLATKKTAP